jgi:cytochrome c biogenesis protein CcdA
MLSNHNEQKSPKRRFLLILGVTAFICFCCLGLMVIFWDKMLPNISKLQRIGFGTIIILYGILRFSRILKRGRDEI